MTTKTNTCPVCHRQLSKEEIAFWQKNDCQDLLDDGIAECGFCQAAEAEAENKSLAFAESGGGQEMINDLWASRVYGDE